MEKKSKPGQEPTKDEQILNDVSRIIWNPDLLKNLQTNGNPVPDGHAKPRKAKL